MAIVTEAELREQIRRPARGLRVAVPAGATFSPAAADFVRTWQLQVDYVAGPVRPAWQRPAGREAATRPAWDRPGSFPVHLEGEPPVCVACGARVAEKPDHMTQLDATHFGPKSSPRIRLRGKFDTINGLALLAGSRARAQGQTDLAGDLGSVAAYARELLAAEYADRPAAPLEIAGLGEAALRSVSHDPDNSMGIGHLVPGVDDDELLHWLNLLRCEVREAELAALDAFPPDPHLTPARASLAHGLNRLSSAIYYLELLLKAGRAGRAAAGPDAPGGPQ